MRIFILVVYARVVKVRDIAFPFYHQGILFRNPIQRHTSTSGIQISKCKTENKESNSYYAFEALCQVFIKECRLPFFRVRYKMNYRSLSWRN